MADLSLQALARVIVSDLEMLLTSKLGFGLVSATPLQRACCRAIDGKPLGSLADLEVVRTAFGGAMAAAQLPHVRPKEVALLAAVRCAKSMLAACTAVRGTQTCDMSGLAQGDPAPRVSCVSMSLKVEVVFEWVNNALAASPVLKSLLARPPTKTDLTLLHPTGREVDIAQAAGARAGSTLISRWSAGVIFDEAPRMLGSADGAVVNLNDLRSSVLGRMLPGAQILEIGSPWAPRGPVYDMICAKWGSPTPEFIAIKAPGPAMNPAHWTPRVVEALRLSGDMAYRTDALGEFADPDESMFPAELLSEVTAPTPTPEPGLRYSAAIDPATRSNAWTLVILAKGRDGKRRIYHHQQWVPNPKLDPRSVLADIGEIVKRFPGAEHVVTDQWSADAIATLAREYGVYIWERSWTSQRKVDLFTGLRVAIDDRTMLIPPDPWIRADLQHVKKLPSPTGGIAIHLVTQGKRHADYAPALALALEQEMSPAQLHEEKAAPGTWERALQDGAEAKALALAEASMQQRQKNRLLMRAMR